MTTDTATWGAERPRHHGFIARIVESIRRARARNRTERALSELDDHVLADIGFNPGSVRRTHSVAEWVLQSNGGTARLVFFGR